MIKGSKAGMSLKNVLTNMANPTDQMSAALEKLGMTADASGSYLKTTADGCTDLEATVKSLKEGTDGMTRSQKASLIATVAGKNALPGVMSLINASTEEYNSLSEAIDNSTSTVSMFNENMSILGLSGKGATDAIENMKQVFSDTEISATALGLSSKDLGFSISLLGDDSKVTKNNVEDLLDVIESMNNASGKTDTAWRNIGNAENLDLNKYIDYNSTLSEIDNSIVGLSGSQKDHVKSLLKENMTVDEANKVLKQYGLSSKQVSLSTMTTSEKMDYLRNSLKGMSDEQMKSELSNLGLANSFDEVNEIVDMSDDKYKKYKDNLETIQGLSDRLAASIDETTVASFYALASAMQDSLLGAFDRLKPALLSGSEALTNFFKTWRGGDNGNYSFSGFEKGLDSLANKVKQASSNIPNLMSDMFAGINRFISGGALDSFLNMGSDIVQGICKGITDNAESISNSISSFIGKISRWITDNIPALIEGGKVILEGIKKGVEENQGEINKAMDVIIDAMSAWIDGKNQLDALCGKFADKFIRLQVEKMKSAVKGKATEIWNALTSGNTTSKAEASGGKLLFGDWNPVEDTKKWFKDKFGNFNLWQWVKDTFLKKSSRSTNGNGGSKVKIGENLFGDWHPIEEIKKWIGDKFKGFDLFGTIKEKLFGGNTTSKRKDSGSVPLKIEDIFKDFHPIEDFKNWIDKAFGDFHPIEYIKDKLFNNKGGTATKAQNSGNELLDLSLFIPNDLVDKIKKKFDETIGSWSPIKYLKEKFSNKGDKKDNSSSISELVKIDPKKLKETENSLKNLQNTANTVSGKLSTSLTSVRESCVSMANVFRNQFLNMANIARNQMVSISNIVRSQSVNQANIVRNQFTNIANIVRNQSQNARNNATRSFISMSKVISTQCTNARTSVVSKMMSINSVVNTQAWKARDNATRAFMSLAAVIRTQMSNALSSVRNAMSQIAAATNRTLTTKVNISKTITTTKVSKSIKAQAQTFSLAATRSLGGINSLATASYGSPVALASTSGGVSGSTVYSKSKETAKTNNKPTYFEIPLVVDGKEIARASAKYMDGEISKINNRNNRKKGV